MDNWIKLIFDGINWAWTNIFAKLWPPVVAVILTQVMNNIRKPKLEMEPEGMQINPILIVNGVSQPGYPMWRIKAENKKLPWFLAWLRSRETALRCKAVLSFSTFQ